VCGLLQAGGGDLRGEGLRCRVKGQTLYPLGHRFLVVSAVQWKVNTILLLVISKHLFSNFDSQILKKNKFLGLGCLGACERSEARQGPECTH